MTVWAIVVAGGGGTRFGGAKQFARLAGVSVLDRSVATARSACDGVVVVLPDGAEWPGSAGLPTAAGGATRAESVRAGLAAVPAEADIVVVHDAARPLASPDLFRRVIAAVREGADGAVPGCPIADTVKRVDGDRVIATVPRDDLVAVQTPQAFRAAVLRDAHTGAPEGPDDAALVEAAGGSIVVVEGEPRNMKLTVADDLAVAEALLLEER